MNLLPQDYTLQTAGDYIKMPGDGQALYFAFLGDNTLFTGWEYWNKEGKPVRKLGAEPFTASEMADVRTDDKGKADNQKHVWWAYVYDTKADKVGILGISQTKVQAALLDFIRSGDYGDMTDSIIKITGAGAGLKRTYMPSVIIARGETLDAIVAQREIAATIDVKSLVVGGPTPAPVDSKVAEVM
jgi:hypothetical protein